VRVQTLRLLEVAAFFGGKFDVRDIAEYVSMPVEAVETLLWQTLHQGLNPVCLTMALRVQNDALF
jgi:hypothetical protein